VEETGKKPGFLRILTKIVRGESTEKLDRRHKERYNVLMSVGKDPAIYQAENPPEVRLINQIQYLNELKKLLSFMSSWDRQATLEQYAAMFREAEDEEALIEKLGSPTKLAIGLAGHYVPTAAPGSRTDDEKKAEDTSCGKLDIF